jgi:hypothetical protein
LLGPVGHLHSVSFAGRIATKTFRHHDHPTVHTLPAIMPLHAKMPSLTKRKREAAPATGTSPPKKVRSDKITSRPAPPPAPELSDDEDEEEIENPTNGESSAATAEDEPRKSFADLGVREELVDATKALGYSHPTPVSQLNIARRSEREEQKYI